MLKAWAMAASTSCSMAWGVGIVTLKLRPSGLGAVALTGWQLALGAVLTGAIGVHDPDAEVVKNTKGEPEPDTSLRDTELVPFGRDIHEYFEAEVAPHVPGAWIDEAKTKIGYEIPFTRLFYTYVPPRPLEEIDAELKQLTAEIIELLSEVER